MSALAALALVAPATASAASAHATAPQLCNPSDAYPFGPNATVQVNTTVARVGDTIKVSGVKYCPDEDVQITIDGKDVGTGHTDSDGGFDPQVKVPGPAGEKQVCGIGASGLTQDADCLTIDARAGDNNGAPGGGGTALTGVEISLLGLAALIAIVGGVIFMTLGRSRRAART